MKNKNNLILILGLYFFIGLTETKAQCPEQGKPVLETQAEIDSFLVIYPGCEYIQGTMAIDNVRIYWVKEEPFKYLAVLSGLLIGILGLLKLIFRKVEWFQDKALFSSGATLNRNNKIESNLKEAIKFPKLKPNQVALSLAKLETGHVLTLNKELRLGKGEIYHVFDSLEEAKEIARKITQENPEIESWISANKDEGSFYISSFEERAFK